MKLIIAGSRNLNISHETLEILLYEMIGKSPDEIISGTARGIDTLGEDIANGKSIKIKQFPADWEKHGKAAGPIRNKEMAEYADALLLIWDGESKGSKNIKENMVKLHKPIYEVILRKP
jgi:hypothetical protein